MRLLRLLLLVAAVASSTVLGGKSFADEQLKVAITARGLYEPSVVELGIRNGHFKKEALDIEPFHVQGSGEQLQILLSGSVDVAVGLGIFSALSANAKGAQLDVIAASSTGSTDLYFYVRGDSPIRSFSDLDGKTIGVTGVGSSSYLAAFALVNRYKTSAKVMVGGGIPAIMTNVMSGQIDVGVSSAPFFLKSVEEGKIKVIAQGSEAPELRDQTTRVVGVMHAMLEKRGDALVRFLRGYSNAREELYSSPDARKWFGELQQLSLDQVTRDLSRYLPPTSTQISEVKGLDLSIQQAKKLKFVPANFMPDQIQPRIRPLIAK